MNIPKSIRRLMTPGIRLGRGDKDAIALLQEKRSQQSSKQKRRLAHEKSGSVAR